MRRRLHSARADLRAFFFNDGRLKLAAFVVALVLYFFVQFEQRTVQSFDVDLLVEPPRGMVVTNPVPPKVRVQMRGSLLSLRSLDSSDFEAIVLNLSGAEPGRVTKVLSVSDVRVSGVSAPELVSIAPSSIEIDLEPFVERPVTVSVEIAGKPAYGYDLVDYFVEPETITVGGAQSAVLAIDTIWTETVDITGRTSGGVIDARLRRDHRGVKIVEDVPIRVTLEIEERIIDRTFTDIEPACDTGRETLVCVLAPRTVELELTGPERLLGRLGAEDLHAYVDISGLGDDGPGIWEDRAVLLRDLPPGISLSNAARVSAHLVEPVEPEPEPGGKTSP